MIHYYTSEAAECKFFFTLLELKCFLKIDSTLIINDLRGCAAQLRNSLILNELRKSIHDHKKAHPKGLAILLVLATSRVLIRHVHPVPQGCH
jgi:hypothetical protein